MEEGKDALSVVLKHMSLDEVQKHLRDGITLEELRQYAENRPKPGDAVPENEPEFFLPEFHAEDFRSGKVFQWLEGIPDSYQRTQAEYDLRDLARKQRVSGFAQRLRAYREEARRAKLAGREDGVSDFLDQALDLNVGEWTADESGIWRRGGSGQPVYACTHPIMPVQLLRSIDTNTVKVKLAYRRSYEGRAPWSELVVPMSRIAKATDIVALADCGISVTSGERAQALVDFLRDAIDRNRELLPEVKAVSRMGWNEEGFSPYVGGVTFDSADSFRPIYKAIGQAGSLGNWLTEALDARSYSLAARIVLAASFASVLVEPLGCLPFFVHLWSMDSGTGKTVAQMLGASVWANPTAGGAYLQTFKSTSVGVELMAGFLHSLPLFLDELQLARDRHGRVNFNVYELAAGSGKLRGNRGLGLDYTPKWANCFITSGETPLVGETDGAGAANRVVEIECRYGEAVIQDGHRTAGVLKLNYGHAGKRFIDRLCKDGEMDRARALYEENYTACIQSDTTEKQAMAAALIITADQLATEWIFQDGRALAASELGEFLKEKNEVSTSERGYEYMCGWVAAHVNQFRESAERGERYGVIDGGMAIINRTIWNKACEEAGLSSKALLGHLKSKELIITASKGYTKTKRIDGVAVHCVWMRLPPDDGESDEYGELPL